ncbi:MAG: primosomal protein N' [Deltaproteobacteria bacterium]|nr:primosomal protein N' [Deltaproteobacteria bacterium]
MTVKRSETPMLAEIAVPVSVRIPYTYLVPKPMEIDLQVGHRVLVTFGSRFLGGYVLELRRVPPEKELKTIAEILDPLPLFPPEMIPFYKWISEYYLYPVGLVIQTGLPGGLSVRTLKEIRLMETGSREVPPADSSEIERQILSSLAQKGTIRLAALASQIEAKDLGRAVRSLERKGWVETGMRLRGDTVRPLEVKVIQKGDVPRKPTPKQGAIWELVAGMGEVLQSEVTARFPGCTPTLRSMEKKGWIRVRSEQGYRDPFDHELYLTGKEPEPSEDQKLVLDALYESLNRDSFQPYMLHGVTGSGKTEVYLRAVHRAMALGKTALVLTPEITLASQMEGHFRSRFGHRLALLHSGLTQGERYDQWMRVVRGEATVVLGVRSAVFAPLRNLGLIVVDEEHEQAYKQEDRLRYHARDLALVRAKMAKAVVLLGSATPSFQSYRNAVRNKYRTITLPKRIGKSVLPRVHVVDMSQEKIGTRFSRQLLERIEQNLSKGDQTLLFLNRRGYSPLLFCPRCRNTVQCPHCHVSLTLHGHENETSGTLLCHYCGFTSTDMDACPVCQFPRLIPLGAGTEKIEKTLADQFPSARIARMDKDAVSSRTDLFRLMKSFHSREIDILVGTQMIAKGLDFPGVTLVGVLAADHSLHFPDYAATERTFQLLSQVSGRSGRREEQGDVVIQTFHPEHYCIENARTHRFHAFYLDEIVHRHELTYPPFCRLAVIRISSPDALKSRDAAWALGRLARERADQVQGIRVLGPAPAPLGKLKGRYRWHILVKAAESVAMHRFLNQVWPQCETALKPYKATAILDVDPVSML